MGETNEELLAAWLKMTSSVRNDRVVAAMSFNEIHICNLLYRARAMGEEPLTATDLCQKTGLLKSQMNKVLTALEKRGMIIRERSGQDKRRILIELNEEKLSIYETEHQRILDFVDQLMEQLGEEDTKETIRLLNSISDKVKTIIDES